MGRYFVRGIEPTGKRRTERVEANTPREALARLESTGWRELELLTDSISAESSAGFESVRPLVEKVFDPAEEHGFRRHGTAWQLWMLVKKGGWVFLLFVAWFLWREVADPGFGGWEGTVWFAILVAAGVVAHMLWSTRRYTRMVEASAAGRWEETLRRADALARSGLAKTIGASELAFRRAVALLGLGREAEALAILEGVDRTGTPDWAFEARLGDFHARRGRLDEALACYRRAAEAGRDHAEAHLSLAEFLAGYQQRDPRGAREALARARTLPIPANCDWGVARIEAMIAVEAGRFAEALEATQRAREALRRLPDPGLFPLIHAHLGAYAAIALAGSGRPADARDWLRPHAPELLARARAAADFRDAPSDGSRQSR
jgi:hypothetical protein